MSARAISALADLTGMHKTGCSGETRLVLLIPSSSSAGKREHYYHYIIIVNTVIVIMINITAQTACATSPGPAASPWASDWQKTAWTDMPHC